MRGKVGDALVLFDGSGCEFDARVLRCDRHEVQLEIVERREVDRELSVSITLAVALPKGDRQQWLVEKLVELGVAELIPVRTERSVAEPREKALERLTRGVIEASKQCGRNRLMRIAAPRDWSELVAAPAEGTLRWLAHPGGAVPSAVALTGGQKFLAAVGPEGGLTDAEVALALDHGWQTVSLGRRILRVETAAAALAAWLGISSASTR